MSPTTADGLYSSVVSGKQVESLGLGPQPGNALSKGFVLDAWESVGSAVALPRLRAFPSEDGRVSLQSAHRNLGNGTDFP